MFLRPVSPIGCCFAFWLTSLCATAAAAGGATAPDTALGNAARAVLEARCFDCHSHAASKLKANLFLDSPSGLLAGGDSGPAVVVGDADASLLIEAVRYQNVDLQMPPKSRLSGEEVTALEAWVNDESQWAGVSEAQSDSDRKGFDLEKRRSEHWAWQPVEPQSAPPVKDGRWPRNTVDQFILGGLEAADLKPAPAAEPRTLVRRLYLMLTGLPPSYEEVEAFVSDPSEESYAELVDRLLASPRLGERWARHWMDVVRYSETLGHEFDYSLPNASLYRDYVIRAINADVPYDDFVREHVAGDLLETPRIDPVTGRNESAAATAFFWFSQQVHSPVDVKSYQLEVIDNQIDTLTRGFQALTVSCARCHDHKFDAISTRDFYALYGVLESSRYAQLNLGSTERRQRTLKQLEGLRARLIDVLDVHPDNAVAAQSSSGTALEARGDWMFQGDALVDPVIRAGDLVFAGESNAVQVAKSGFLSSRRLSPKLQGTMHSRTFSIDHRYVHLRAAGRSSRANLVLENFQLIRDPIYGGIKKSIDRPEFHWITFDLDMWRGRKAYLEILDQQIPDLADSLSGGGYDPGAWFDVAEVVFSDERQPPDREPLLEEVAVVPEASRILAKIEGVNVPPPVTIPGLMDGDGVNEHVFIRGGANNPGDLVERRYLEALGGLEQPVRDGSGRLEVAELIASPENPLTARVWVNRVWHQLFGRGIVPTVDDFGLLGDKPSHPELLDWLARWFVTEGEWSTRRLIRMLVMTRAWQQSAVAADSDADGASEFDGFDPENVLLHKWSVRRLEGEAIRDSILAVSGRLDLVPPDGSVPVHLTPFLTGRGRPGTSGPQDGDGKRSVYLEMRRNFMPPMMLAFDTPQTAQTFGRRARSNVPAQALILLNDPFVHQQAELFSRRSLQDAAGDTPVDRIDWIYETALQRKPTHLESRAAREFVESSDGDTETAWVDLCHVLFNTKEFAFVN